MTLSKILHQDKASTVSIVNLIPERLLTESNHTQEQTLPPHTQGGIVSTHAGASIAYLLSYKEDDEGGSSFAPQLNLWKHTTYPRSEDFILEKELLSLTHPNYPTSNSSSPTDEQEPLVAVIPEATLGHHRLARSNPLVGMGIYWISPCGSLAYWNTSEDSHSHSKEPRLTQDLDLDDGDVFTCLYVLQDPGEGSNTRTRSSRQRSGPPTLFLGTAQQKVYSLVKTTRPLGMQLIPFNLSLELPSSDSSSLLGGIYNSIFTPAKKSKKTLDPSTAGAAAKDAPLVALYANTLQGSERGSSKVRKLTHPNSTTKGLELVTLSQSGDWNRFVSEEGAGSGSTTTSGGTLQCTSRCDFRTLLKDYFAKERDGLSSSHQEFNVQVVSSTRSTSTGTNTRSDDLVVCVKVTFSEEWPGGVEEKQEQQRDGMSGQVSRIYVLWCGTHADTNQLFLYGAHWLNGYSSSSMEGPNALELVGLVARSDDLEDEQKREVTIYCVMQQASEQQVTCSAIRFVGRIEGEEELQQEQQPQYDTRITVTHCVDVNVSSNMVPYLVRGMIRMDIVMGGCVLISSSGIVLNARMNFPPLLRVNASNEPSSTMSSRSDSIVPSKEMVQVLTSHLVSTFDNYEKRNHYTAAESLASTLPQSILAADPTTLSVAVAAASQHLTNERITSDSRSSTMSSSSSSSASYCTASALHNIHLKMERHRSFINFLVRAGVYKRVNIRGRMELRNHGEMIHAIGVLLTLWQDEIENVRRSEDGSTSTEQDADIMKVTQDLKRIEELVTDFPGRILSILKKYGLDESRYEGTDMPWSLYQMCKLISGSIEGAIFFRDEQSGILYDLLSPDEGGWGQQSSKSIEGGCFPWTSRDEILASLPLILKVCDDGSLEESGEMVRCIGTVLLDGHRDITPTIRDEQLYYKAKELVVSLASKFFPCDSGDPLEDLAFQLSVQHGYFAGIVESCQNNTTSAGFFSENYDLGSILYSTSSSDPDSHTSIDDPYLSLSSDRDQETGLSFPKFVFRWYTDRNMIGTVLLLGKACPSILTEYMQEDARLSDSRWIQYVDDEQYSKSSTCLLNLVSEGTAALGEKSEYGPSLEDRQLVLSLAKLSSLAAGPKKSQHEKAIIDENLKLCSAQQQLLDIMNGSDEIVKSALPAEELIQLALEQANSLKDSFDKSRACLVGLSVASVLSSTSSTKSGGVRAARMWSKAIDIDSEEWEHLAQEYDTLSEYERISRIENTVFYQLNTDFYYSREINMKGNIEFKNELIKNRALGFLSPKLKGAEEMLLQAVELSTIMKK